MKYLTLILAFVLSGCYVAPYDPYYGTAYPAYGGYYGPNYYAAPAPAYVSVGYGGGYRGGYYGHRYWR